jgi:hypothetical protein
MFKIYKMKKTGIFILIIIIGYFFFENISEENKKEQVQNNAPVEEVQSVIDTSSVKETPNIEKVDSSGGVPVYDSFPSKKETHSKPKKMLTKKPKTSVQKSLLNPGKVIITEGMDKKIDIHQTFKYANDKGEFVSKVYDLNIDNPGFISFSAYTLDMSDNIKLYFRYNNGQSWSGWKELPKDTHIVNHKRNVFGLLTLKDPIKEIQFKSNVPPVKEVVFHFFIPKN